MGSKNQEVVSDPVDDNVPAAKDSSKLYHVLSDCIKDKLIGFNIRRTKYVICEWRAIVIA